jgi:hypothetical protein
MLFMYRDLIPFLNVPFFVFEILFYMYICSRFLFSDIVTKNRQPGNQELLLAATL